MKRSLLLVIVSLFVLASVQAMNYPSPFLEEDKANVFIVYPLNGNTQEKIAAAEIHQNLAARLAPFTAPHTTTSSEYQTIIISDNETSLFGDYNLISVGLNCENKVSNLILELNQNCSNFEEKANFTEGYLIKIVQSPYNSSKIAMIVLATDNNLLNNATRFIISNNFSTDIGTEIREIKTAIEIKPVEVKISFFQRIINWFKRLF